MKSQGITNALVILLLIPTISFAQQPSAYDLKPTNCEMNAAKLDGIPQTRFQGNSADDVVIVIARPGSREFSHELNRRRLFNVRYRLEKYRGLQPGRVVLAEGDRVKGYGRVELYVDGKLFDVLVASPGKDLCVSCCGHNDDFYPERKQRTRK